MVLWFLDYYTDDYFDWFLYLEHLQMALHVGRYIVTMMGTGVILLTGFQLSGSILNLLYIGVYVIIWMRFCGDDLQLALMKYERVLICANFVKVEMVK